MSIITDKFIFTDDEIRQVCKELGLPENTYDDLKSERRIIIDSWQNANIIACPGSGKTTVLLVKLLLLSKRMPFTDGSGICVLTHTNVAIDEIKNRLGTKADILFQYPNFFGTIQSFVGKFLLKKSLWLLYSSSVNVVDTDLFNLKLVNKFKKLDHFNSSLHKLLFNYAYSQKITKQEIEQECFTITDGSTKEISKKAKTLLDSLKNFGYLNKKTGELIYQKCKSINADDLPNEYAKQFLLKKLIDEKHRLAMSEVSTNKCNLLVSKLRLDLNRHGVYDRTNFKLIAGEKTNSFKELKAITKNLLEAGYVSYESAFELSTIGVQDFPQIGSILSSRFRMLFVDEMQDTQQHQMDIINSVFNQTVIKQYFGDPDQAIFNGGEGQKSSWQHEQQGFLNLTISDSKRFGDVIAQSINPFKQVLPVLTGNTEQESIRPTILLYDDPKEVVGLFAQQIKSHGLDKQEWKGTSAAFNLVGFVGKATQDKTDKLTLHSYVAGFSKETAKRKTNFDNLVSYFQPRPTIEIAEHGTKIYYDLFINALVSVFNLDPANRYSKTKLLAELKENQPEFLAELNLSMVDWIIRIEYGSVNPNVIKNEFIGLLQKNNYLVPVNDRFINEKEISAIDTFTSYDNLVIEDGIEIKISTIHSVKGETHMATMLVENEDHSESEATYFWNHKLKNDLFCGNNYVHPKSGGSRLYETLKRTYVAMSRPTHLLCVAVHKDKAGCPKCPQDKKANCKWQVVSGVKFHSEASG
ncbi:UvrD-helicase domain-containing protein [Catenovulum agarivorans]|uniref:UvrD-helicase domain-containing protein n=1 Tax=Catenovulum agarivorans TaxID=1172192 RepID=UPI0002F0B91D|nr:UvrD-helicase domain-containing protein [Catenovulum agarivorans]